MGKGLKKIAKQKDKPMVPGAMTVRERMAFNKGLLEGKNIGIEESIKYFTEKMETLSDIKGIGEKKFLLIAHHLGFQEKEQPHEGTIAAVPKGRSENH